METREQIYRQLRELRDHLGAETGRYGEISDGEIVMVMSPVPQHGLTAKRIVRQLDAQLPEPLAAFGNTDTDDEHLGKLRIPDIVVVPEEAMDTTSPLDPREITLAVEIVSRSNPDNDYVKKVADYAAMGIPHYLIVDPRSGTARHLWAVVAKEGRPVYDNQVSYAYGEIIPIGDLRIGTSDLPLYSDGPGR
ncbi:Uma2 family endonuclease [Streptomyces sp. UNOC14_S4]|uniref:Uma2 family endonuclease n=1 Tax=Streptomyces sp. UNOC14_S4 TaxID=2872340 RepID=UPI001E34BF0A|nr:Uma2 family endonuclease [Streptomyces sp. UNOC14_S4]MCC3769810.1 Uma2 family endonuclease [Streptomyces sp. UNOC14_S4]